MKDNDDFEIEMFEEEDVGIQKPLRKSKRHNGHKKEAKTKSQIKNKKKSYPEDIKKDKERIEDEMTEEHEMKFDHTHAKKAKKMPISEGIKRRLLLNARDINKMKNEMKQLKKEIKGYENEVEILEMETENLRSEKEEMEDNINKDKAIINAMEKKLDRTHKDFDGYKTRIQKEIERKSLMKMKDMIIPLIEIMDNFDRTIQEAKKYRDNGQVNNILNGMESIKKIYLKLLSDNRIDMIKPQLEQFDPKYHEAIEIVMDHKQNENTVVQVESNGYMLDGVVLKPARVVVTKGGPKWTKRESSGDEILEELDELEDMDDLEEIEDE